MDEQSDGRLTTIPLRFQRGEIMAEVSGRLITDLHPNGTVRIVFIASVGGGNGTPFTAKNLDAAEVIFMTCGLMPIRAAEIRAELEGNRFAASLRASTTW